MKERIFFIFLFLCTSVFGQGHVEHVISEGLNALPGIAQGPVPACAPDGNPLENLVRPEDKNAGRCEGNNNRQPLKVNEYRVMTWRDGRSKHGAQPPQPRLNPVTNQDRFYETGNYLLKRPSANQYQIVMNLDIVPKPVYPATATVAEKASLDEQLRQETLTKIRECMHTLQPHLRGPQGETMEIRILTPSQTNTLPAQMRPLPRSVEVSPAHNGRGNADNFGTNFTCPTIGHELLHHLGLCDEYLEVDPAIATQWSCRVTPIATSFMKETFFAFDQTVPQTLSCDCSSDQLCKDAMAEDSKLRQLYLSKDSEDILEVNYYLKYCSTQPQLNDSIAGTVSDTDPAPISRLGFRSQATVEGGTKFIYDRIFPTGKTTYSKQSQTCLCPSGDNYCLNMSEEMKKRTLNPPQRTKCPQGTTARTHTMNTTNGVTGLKNNILTIQNPGNNQSLLKPNQFRKILAGDCIGQAPGYERCSRYSNIPASSDKCVDREACSDASFHGTSAQ